MEHTLRMDQNNIDILIGVLRESEARAKALANLRHTNEAEKHELMNVMCVCQMAYLQLEGIQIPKAYID